MQSEKLKYYRKSEVNSESLFNKVKQILSRDENIVFAYVYGSSVEEEVPLFRDIDVGIYLKEYPPDLMDQIRYCSLLEHKLRETSIPVDVRIINKAPLSFQYKVTKGRLLFVRDAEICSDFLEKTWNYYLDMKPLLDEYFKEILKGEIKQG